MRLKSEGEGLRNEYKWRNKDDFKWRKVQEWVKYRKWGELQN